MNLPVQKKITCSQCANFELYPVDSTRGDCTVWDKQIKKGVSTQQNAHFYRVELGGDGFYSALQFLADEDRDCKRFLGRYDFVTGD